MILDSHSACSLANNWWWLHSPVNASWHRRRASTWRRIAASIRPRSSCHHRLHASGRRSRTSHLYLFFFSPNIRLNQRREGVSIQNKTKNKKNRKCLNAIVLTIRNCLNKYRILARHSIGRPTVGIDPVTIARQLVGRSMDCFMPMSEDYTITNKSANYNCLTKQHTYVASNLNPTLTQHKQTSTKMSEKHRQRELPLTLSRDETRWR